MKYELKDVMVTSYTVNGSADGRSSDEEFEFVSRDAPAEEDFNMTFSAIKVDYGDLTKDDHKDWIDILTMSPPVTQEGDGASHTDTWTDFG